MSINGIGCDQTRALLEAYYEGALDAKQERQVGLHLEQCLACRAELAAIVRVVSALEAAPRTEPGVELLRAISLGVAALPTPLDRRREFAGWGRVALIGACAVAGLGVLSYFSPALLGGLNDLLQPVWSFGHKLGGTAIGMGAWVLGLVKALLPAVKELVRQAWLALPRVTPTIAAYVAAEIFILLAAVRVMGRRPKVVRIPMLSMM